MWASNTQTAGGIVPIFTNLPRFDHQPDPVASIALLPHYSPQPDQRADNLIQQLTTPAGNQEELSLLEGQISGIVHDFNNLLGIILSHTSIALHKLPTDKQVRSYLETVVRTTRRAADLSGQLMAVLKGRKIEVALLDLNEIVKEAVALLLLKCQNRIEITQKLAGELDLIHGNDIQFHQVVMNLLVNAIDAIEQTPGWITVETRNLHLAETRYRGTNALPAGDYVFLQVSDSGIGMTQETLNRIFEPYFTTKRTGSGIGLHATLAIVQAYQGAIQVFSTPGRGTTFQIFLPTDSFEELF